MQNLAKLLEIFFKVADPDCLRQLQRFYRLKCDYALHLILFLGGPQDVIMHIQLFLTRSELDGQF